MRSTRNKPSTSPFRSLPYTGRRQILRQNLQGKTRQSVQGTMVNSQSAKAAQDRQKQQLETSTRPNVTSQEKPPALQETSTWANDEQESEQSPKYQLQLRRERREKEAAEAAAVKSTSLVQQVGKTIQEFTHSTAAGQDKVGKESNKGNRGIIAGTDIELPTDNMIDQTNRTVEKGEYHTGSGEESQDKDEGLKEMESDSQAGSPPTKRKPPAQREYQDDNFDGWEINDTADEEPTQEDDIDTIDSGATSKRGHVVSNRITIPNYVRFQLMIPQADESDSTPSQADYNDNYNRIKEVLSNLTAQIRSLDSKAEIISWKASKDFTFLPKGSFPDEVAKIAKYFKGFKKRMHSNRRTYIKFGLHTSADMTTLEEELKGWVDLYSYTLNRCLIQSDDAGFVGSIIYTSQFTDTKIWKDCLMERTDYEWGFKMVPLTSTDKKTPWNKRLKAIGAYVPIDNVEEAKFELSDLLLPENLDFPTPSPYLDRYVYVPPEETIGDDPEHLIAYQSFVHRHRSHSENLKAKLCTFIKVDLDMQLAPQSDPTLTLRSLILKIMVKDKNNPLFNTNLFHSVDFCPDVEKLYMPNKEIESGPAVIFTYYKPAANEAIQMVTGLGRYTARMYGSDIAKAAFAPKHWRATKGWRYRASTGTFDRPDTKNLMTTMAFDNNLTAIRRLQQITMESTQQQPENPTQPSSQSTAQTATLASENGNRYTEVEELLATTEDQSNASSDPSSFTQTVLQQEIDIVNKIKEERVKAERLLPKSSKIPSINIIEDQSDVSVLTDQSVVSEDQSVESVTSLQSCTDSRTTRGTAAREYKHSLTTKILDKIITSDMSKEQAEKTAEAYYLHKMNHASNEKDKILQEYLQTRFVDSSYQVNKGQSSQATNFSEEVSKMDKELHTPQEEERSYDGASLEDISRTSEPHDKIHDHSLDREQVERPASSQNTGDQP